MTAPTPFSPLRYFYYKHKLKYSGGEFHSEPGFDIQTPSKVSIGKDVFFNKNVMLAAIQEEPSEIMIGNNCLFGLNVIVVAADHPVHDISKPMRWNCSIGGTINIGNGCWIGANTVITKDVMIGRGSVIGAGSVVTHDIPEMSVAVGSPARVIKKRGVV